MAIWLAGIFGKYFNSHSGVTFGSVLHAVVISSIVGFVVGGMCGWFLGRGMVMVGLVSLAGIGIGAIAGVLALIPLERGWDRQEMMHAGMAILIALMLLGERFNTRDRSFGEQRTGDV